MLRLLVQEEFNRDWFCLLSGAGTDKKQNQEIHLQEPSDPKETTQHLIAHLNRRTTEPRPLITVWIFSGSADESCFHGGVLEAKRFRFISLHGCSHREKSDLTWIIQNKKLPLRVLTKRWTFPQRRKFEQRVERNYWRLNRSFSRHSVIALIIWNNQNYTPTKIFFTWTLDFLSPSSFRSSLETSSECDGPNCVQVLTIQLEVLQPSQYFCPFTHQWVNK